MRFFLYEKKLSFQIVQNAAFVLWAQLETIRCVLIVSDGYEYEPYDEIAELELYAMQEGYSEEEFEELCKKEIVTNER